MCGGGEDNGGMGPGGMGGGGIDREREERARDAQREAGRATDIEALDKADRFIQNNYRSQIENNRSRFGQGVVGSVGRREIGQSQADHFDDPSTDSRQGSHNQYNEMAPDFSSVKDKEVRKEASVRRASRNRTVLTALNIRRHKLSVRETLGTSEVIG